MTRKILLTGKNGQVGRELNRLLPHLGELVAFDRNQLDLAKPDAIRQAIRAIRPAIIVNAAAYTAVDKAESDQAAARAINADAPEVIAEEARKIGAIVVHYSTDYVFDGSGKTPYVEDAPPNPINSYGKTKLAGEQAIQQAQVPYLIFRTAWVYSTEGNNFLLTILRLATQRQELRIVCDQIGAPTSSREIAKATCHALSKLGPSGKDVVSFSELSGIYHMTAAGETTWYEFAGAIIQEFARTKGAAPWMAVATNGQSLLASRVVPITTSEYPTPARRPLYSVLSNSKFVHAFGICLPDWQTQLQSVFSQS